MKITVVGLGFVGLSNAALLAANNSVVGLDIAQDRIDMINAGRAPIADDALQSFLDTESPDLCATRNARQAYSDTGLVLIATPTHFDPSLNALDTSGIKAIVRDAQKYAPNAPIVIKSTVPVGFTDELCRIHQTRNILFSPEFLREGNAFHDCRVPSRIVVGGGQTQARMFADLHLAGTLSGDAPVFLTSATEAESIKLFANAYLAMRVSFFNELDTYALSNNMDAARIIKGLSADPRIGGHYNNPSFGYGGNCLPKDTKQLVSGFGDIPQDIFQAIVQSNSTRIDFIARAIINRNPRVVGIFGLGMKKGSDNFSHSAIQGVMQRLADQGIKLVVYEPALDDAKFRSAPVIRDLAAFKSQADVIVTNRMSANLNDVTDKVFTRDLFGTN